MTVRVQLANDARYAAFQELFIEEKVAKGWIRPVVTNLRGPPKYIRPHGYLPPGTVGQVIEYFVQPENDEPWMLVKVHQYRLPNGSITGGPDPLYIRLHDVVLAREERAKSVGL